MWTAEILQINDNPVPDATAQMTVTFSHEDGRTITNRAYSLMAGQFSDGDAVVTMLRAECRKLDEFDALRSAVTAVKGKVAVQADGVVSLDKDIVIGKGATVAEVQAAIDAKAIEVGGIAEPLVP